MAAAEGTENDVLAPAAPRAAPVEQRHAAVELEELLRDLLRVVADDIGHLGGVRAVDDLVHQQRGDIERDDAVERAGHVAEDERVAERHEHVDHEAERADGDGLELELQQPRGQLRAAGGGALAQHHAEGDAADRTAVETREDGIHRLERMHRGERVDHDGADGRGVQGGKQQRLADLFPPEDKERDVHHQRQRTDRQLRQIVVDDLGDAGKAAHADVVGVEAPVKADRVEGAGGGDDPVARQDFG